ncbi:MAG: response regulator [Chloroflexota bacterium]|nr:response regulator [Chloroflexota bacterium]
MALGSTGAGGISAANGGMIILVEDDNRISRLERFVLDQVGYRVTHAFSEEEALEMLPNFTPSLVLLDVMLLQMDGFATCQKIRECSQVPIIMVTAMDQDEDKVWGRLLERPIGRLRRRFIL